MCAGPGDFTLVGDSTVGCLPEAGECSDGIPLDQLLCDDQAPICVRYEIVVEGKVGGIDGLAAQLFQLPGDGDPFALLNEEQAHSLVSGLCILCSNENIGLFYVFEFRI